MRSSALIPVLLIIAGCGGHSDNSSDGAGGTSPSNPASAPVPASATPANTSTGSTIGAGGGSITLPSVASVTFPENAVPASTPIVINKREGGDSAGVFDEGTIGFGSVEGETFDIQIDVGTQNVASDAITVTIFVTDAMATIANSGRELAAFVQGLDQSDDDEARESIDVFDMYRGGYDSATRSFTVVLPADAFDTALSQHAGHLAAVLRIAALPADSAVAPVTNAVAKAPSTSTKTCLGDASWGAPYVYGWREAAKGNPLLYYDAIAGVIAPFAEPRSPKPGHSGIDFFADLRTPVLAVADGYIEVARKQGNKCPDKKHASAPADDPEITAVLAITDPSGTVTDRVVYRHLTEGSIGLRSWQNIGNTKADVQEPTFSTCWVATTPAMREKYHVKKGDVIALSGDTGTFGSGAAHLHMEWVPAPGIALPDKVAKEPEGMRNPLCKLATFFPGKIDPFNPATNTGYGDPKQAEFGERLYVQPAPHTVDYNGKANTLAEIWVLRNKPIDPRPPVCQVTGGAKKCDWGGHGYFMYPLDNPHAGSFWPKQVQGIMATPKYAAVDNRLTFTPYTTNALTNAQPEDQGTPPPNTTYDAFSVSTTGTPSSCPFVTQMTYTVQVPWYRRDTTLKNPAQFTPYSATATAAKDMYGTCLVTLH
jgi:murein DD-endopeptidase MepM/ murein hydrolase activator NlpD